MNDEIRVAREHLRPLRIAVVVGTRPESIKLAPLVVCLRIEKDLEVVVINTGQHGEVVNQTLGYFDLSADHELPINRKNGSLNELVHLLVAEIDYCYRQAQPDLVVVQGDTTSALCGALAAVHLGIKVVHVEAGLRTSERMSPFPEEINRRIITELTDLHLAPTSFERATLEREGIEAGRICVTGNTSIDAALSIKPVRVEVPSERYKWLQDKSSLRLLITMHRRENWGSPLENLASVVRQSVGSEISKGRNWRVLWSMHPNPNVSGLVRESLGGIDRVHLEDSIAYPDFVNLMGTADLIITDSGGIQEEAPALGTPCIVMRTETERLQSIETGTACLMGDRFGVLRNVLHAMQVTPVHEWSLADAVSPYGDGRAAERSVAAIKRMADRAHPSGLREFVFDRASEETPFSRFMSAFGEPRTRAV